MLLPMCSCESCSHANNTHQVEDGTLGLYQLIPVVDTRALSQEWCDTNRATTEGGVNLEFCAGSDFA